MKHPVIIGLQFGDEGKGKITDLLASQADYVIRFNGGANAGHTLWVDGKKIVTHSVPSGVLYPTAKNYIGSGCVIDPVALAKELTEIKEAGVTLGPDRLEIDFRAHITLPIHKALDAAREATSLGLGTTKKGIGPTYAAKMDRLGIRAGDLKDPELNSKIETLCRIYNPLLIQQGIEASAASENIKVLQEASKWLSPHVVYDPTPFFEKQKTKKCLLEGAQAALLDIDHGTYPFVTSSHTVGAYAAVGAPFPMRNLSPIIGVAKAYLTRVGLGPLPSAMDEKVAHDLREKGAEYGATTGRPRRMAWLNLDELKLAVKMSDCEAIALTKSDILSGLKSVFAYKNDKLCEYSGWETVLSADKKTLDKNMEAFVSVIEAHVGVPVACLGTGSERNAIFWRRKLDFWAQS